MHESYGPLLWCFWSCLEFDSPWWLWTVTVWQQLLKKTSTFESYRKKRAACVSGMTWWYVNNDRIWMNYSFNLPMHRELFQVMRRCPQANNDSQNLYQWRNGLSEMSAVSWGFCVWHAPHGASVNHALFSRSLSDQRLAHARARGCTDFDGADSTLTHIAYNSSDTRFWPFVEVLFLHWSRSPHDTWQNE